MLELERLLLEFDLVVDLLDLLELLLMPELLREDLLLLLIPDPLLVDLLPLFTSDRLEELPLVALLPLVLPE